MTTVVTVFGNSGIMQEVMLFIQTMTNSSAYNQLVQIFLVIGLALATFKGSMEHQFQHRTTVVHFLVVATLVYAFYIPKATVILQDQINGTLSGPTSYQLPTGIAYAMHFGSEIEKGLVSLTNSATALPPAEQYGTTTYSWGPQAIAAMPSVSIQDDYPYLFATVNDFFSECVITGVLLHKINQADLYKTQDLLDFINPARYHMPGAYTSLIYSSKANRGESCQDVYIYIKSHLLALQTADIPDQYKRVILSKTALDGNPTKIAGYLGTVGNDLLGGSLTGEQMLMQNIMAKSMEKGIQSFAMTYSTNPNLLAYTTTNALDKAVTSMTTSAYLAKQFLPWLHIIIEAIVYATMPLAFFMMLLPQLTKKVVFTYVTLILWLALWGPIMAIINDIIYVHGHQVMSQFQGVLSLATYPEIVTKAQALQAMAGSMLWFVPIIAFSMASLSTYGFTSLASGLGGTLHSAGMAAGGSVSGIGGRQALTDSLNKGVEEHEYGSDTTANYMKENDRANGALNYGRGMEAKAAGYTKIEQSGAGAFANSVVNGIGASKSINQTGMSNAIAAKTATDNANFAKGLGIEQMTLKDGFKKVQQAFESQSRSNVAGGEVLDKYGAVKMGKNEAVGKYASLEASMKKAQAGGYKTYGDYIKAQKDAGGMGSMSVMSKSMEKGIFGKDMGVPIDEKYSLGKNGITSISSSFAITPQNSLTMEKRLDKAGLHNVARFLGGQASLGHYGKMDMSVVKDKDGNYHLLQADYRSGGEAMHQNSSYEQDVVKTVSGKDIKAGNTIQMALDGSKKNLGMQSARDANYAVGELKKMGLSADSLGKGGGMLDVKGGKATYTGTVSKEGIQSMINNRKAYNFSDGEVEMLKEDEKSIKEGKLGGVNAEIIATSKGITMSKISAGSETGFTQKANTDKTTKIATGFSGVAKISKDHPENVQVGSSKQDWLELSNGSVIRNGDQVYSTSTLSRHEEGNLANRLQIVDDKRRQKGEKPLYTNVIGALKAADTAGRSSDIKMTTTAFGQVGSLSVNSGGKMTTTDTSVAEETNSKLFGTNISFGGLQKATKDLMENNYAQEDGQLTVAGHEARMQDTQILGSAIQNIDNIGDAKTRQVARNEFAATVSQQMTSYASENFKRQSIAGKNLKSGASLPNGLPISAGVSVTAMKNAGQSTYIAQSEGRLYTSIENDLNNSNPGVASQKITSLISDTGNLARRIAKKGKYEGVNLEHRSISGIADPKDDAENESLATNVNRWENNFLKRHFGKKK